MRFLAAVVQLNGSSDEERNRSQAEELIRGAATEGARLVATPENTNYLGPHAEKVRRAESLSGPTVGFFRALAAELGIDLLLGSFNERSDEPARCYNTSVWIDPEGQIQAVYRKIHLFDVDVSDEVRFQESATVVAGEELVVMESELGSFGLSICYDLRFGELYRALTEKGAQILTVPSAFTATTGQAHWETLLRARAIENQCWVVAPGQWGAHDDGGLRESWGHSMIVDPWGVIVAQVEEGTGFALAEIDLERVDKVRRGIPVAEHRRL